MNPDPDEHAHPGQEDLHWGEGIKETQRDKKPVSKYSVLGEQARKIIPGESQCRMFCGGKACKYCTPDNWRPEQMIIKGLYSEWVTDNILAMARMSTPNIEKFKMIDQLKKNGVKTILNLQQPGEHAYCGHGVHSSGFSYDPQQFMESGFFFYNFVMEDYGVASMQKLLDIVKVTQFAVSQGKVAIHCHAGLGRTGLIIACYLIYNNRVKAGKSIQYVRSRRAGAIQTKEQVKTCHEFEKYLKPFYIIFPCRMPDMNSFSFNLFLHRQLNLLHGYEGRKLKHLPKIMYVCCERLLELCGKGRALSSLRQVRQDKLKDDLKDIDSCDGALIISDSELNESICGEDEGFSPNAPNATKPEKTSISDWKGVKTSSAISGVDETSSDGRKRLLRRTRLCDEDKDKTAADYCEESSEDDEEVDGKLNLHSSKHIVQEQFAYDTDSDNDILDIPDVCNAIMQTEFSSEESVEIQKIEEDLNVSDDAWSCLARQRNPSVVCGIMWDWFDELCEPILRAQDVYTLIRNSTDLYVILSRLEKHTKYFLEYIARVLSKLDMEHLPPSTLHSVLRRFLCHLTQKRHGNFDDHPSSSVAQMIEEKPDVSQSLLDLFMRIIMRERERR